MEIVLAAIASLEEADEPVLAVAPGAESVESLARQEPQLSELAHLLAANDAEACTCLANILHQIENPSLRAEFRELEKLIQRYDFEPALNNLQQLAQKQGVQLRKA